MISAAEAVVDICEYIDRCSKTEPGGEKLTSPNELNVERMSTLLCRDVLDGLVWSESLFTKREASSEFRGRLSKLLTEIKEGDITSRKEILMESERLVRELVLWARSNP